MTSLVQACDAFFEEYQRLPLANLSSPIDSVKITTGKDQNIMPILMGLPFAENENPKLQPFFEYRDALKEKGGLIRSDENIELVDPWGGPYHVLFNYDNDQTLKAPFYRQIIKDRRVLIWSNGPDGKSGTPDTNKDNVYSWNVSRPN